MQPPYEEQIRTALSPTRLDPYASGATTREAVENYLWNVALCSALYPVLHVLEVGLRNSLDRAISAKYPVTDYVRVNSWLDRYPAVIADEDKPMVGKAMARLEDRGEALEHGKLVAELSFGFWTALFDVRYERGQILWPKLLRPVFPHMPRGIRKRKEVSPRLNRLRHLRNRVFHYEPIWHWRDLMDQHDEAVKVISWIDPALRSTLDRINRFPEVHQVGASAFREDVDALFGLALAGP